MQSSEENNSKEVKKEKLAKSSLSKDPSPINIKLKPYEFDPKNLEAFVKKYDGVDPITDMKTAKKARADIKKKINDIKSVHIANKKVILQFKRDVEEYDLKKFSTLITDLQNAFNRINYAIDKIESGAAIRAQEIQNRMSELHYDLQNAILNASTTKEIMQVQAKINSLVPTANDFEGRLGEAEHLITSLTIKAGGRANEILNAGGSISKTVKPMNLDPIQSANSRRYTDSELLNFLQANSAIKGWIATINPNTGVALYQIDDPKAPKDLRTAIEDLMLNHKSV